MYKFLFKYFFTKLDAEFAHHLGVLFLKTLFLLGLIRPKKSKSSFKIMGLSFENRLGMAAGFDKNAHLVRELYALGFGHVEIGTVTALPQPGNPKPRLFRSPSDRALINRMGFNNDGAEVIAQRLAKLRAGKSQLPIIGINIGKSKVVELDSAQEDYRASARLLAPYADYLVVNVSSPNTPGLRSLQSVESLEPILNAVLEEAKKVPLLVKVAPDLADEDLLEIAKLVKKLRLAGVVATNTTISREGVSDSKVAAEAGGLSGPMLAGRAEKVLQLLRHELGKSFTIVSVGGVQTKADFERRIQLGADLVQGYTGFIYFGPNWPKQILS